MVFQPSDEGTILIQPCSTGEAGHVLLVLDDDSAVRNSLKFSLETEGFEVREYVSADELLDDDDSLPALSCLIVDYHMPEMSGLDVIARLRGKRKRLHAILVTGHPDKSIRERAAAVGVPVVEKPVQGSALTDCIHTVLAMADRE
jgi:two-component system, LuxR family, response regulator FixJ